MPTGYTADVQSGKITEFRDYALTCARAFGACITLRDDPLSTEIPVFEPSPHHRDALEKAKASFGEWQAMSDEDRRALHAKEHKDSIANADRYIAERNEQRRRYEAMLSKAMEFVPPSEDHVALRQFMIDQLIESIKWDCGSEYWEKQKQPIPFDKWQEQRTGRLLRDIEYHADEWKKEQERTASRNRWVQQLRDALAGEQ